MNYENDKSLNVEELEDRIQKTENGINTSTRALAEAKIHYLCLKATDLSQLDNYASIRDEALATYQDDKQPVFKEDLIEKAEKKVKSLNMRIDGRV
jgi:hypothetical protein